MSLIYFLCVGNTTLVKILDSNCNIWKRQLEKVKDDEENAKRRQEIDDELDSKQ